MERVQPRRERGDEHAAQHVEEEQLDDVDHCGDLRRAEAVLGPVPRKRLGPLAIRGLHERRRVDRREVCCRQAHLSPPLGVVRDRGEPRPAQAADLWGAATKIGGAL
jgi:hypothetical protein